MLFITLFSSNYCRWNLKLILFTNGLRLLKVLILSLNKLNSFNFSYVSRNDIRDRIRNKMKAKILFVILLFLIMSCNEKTEMSSTYGQQGLSFTTQGIRIK